MKKIITSADKQILGKIYFGDEVLLSGTIYTARDQAHKKLIDLIEKEKKLPFDLKNKIIYYCGPTQTPKGKIIGTSTSLSANGERSRTIGSCGPTTSLRMDEFVEPLLRKGLIAMIGKGRRSKKVRELVRKYRAIYFVAPSGCGAFLAKKVVSKKLVCFKELGPEAIYKLEVKDFPLIVAIDSRGKSIYEDQMKT